MQALFPEGHFTEDQMVINETKPEFEGDYTLVLFPFVKILRTDPASLGKKIGDALLEKYPNLASAYSVVAGFLNITVPDALLLETIEKEQVEIKLLPIEAPKRIMIEYSSPNTNKPLHFGHLRNNFLGWSVAEILKKSGHHVVKANLINDRGIHICKSMIAWKRYGQGQTPQSTGIKGDHLVGDFYVKYNDIYKKEVKNLMDGGLTQEQAEREAPIFKEAQDMLLKWEQGDKEIYTLWQTMNQWVYDGFDITYKDLGIDFDTYYYESDTYLLGKNLVQKGLEDGVLFKKENGSVWIDLNDEGLDEKLLLRADGTSVYMTQDLGTARKKYEDHQLDQSVYVIADEQNYHMQVLQAILKKMGEPCADGIFHLSYGMVELPSGRMKSREGTVVDADDMISEMIRIAQEQTEEAGKTEGFSTEDLDKLYRTIGLGALKFYLLRVDPKKKMIFDPKESIDLHGFTAAYIQYVHARISSVLRKTGKTYNVQDTTPLEVLEKNVLLRIEQYPSVVAQAASEMNPGLLCNYVFKLAQTFNSFFDKHSIVNAESEVKKNLRIGICIWTAATIKHCMQLLGIEVPEKM